MGVGVQRFVDLDHLILEVFHAMHERLDARPVDLAVGGGASGCGANRLKQVVILVFIVTTAAAAAAAAAVTAFRRLKRSFRASATAASVAGGGGGGGDVWRNWWRSN